MNKFKDNSTTIQIPSFDGLGTIEIKVKRPQTNGYDDTR